MRRSIIWLLLAPLAVTFTACAKKDSHEIQLQGAGATFPAPLYRKWFADYQNAHPTAKVDYDAMGSGAGIQLFTEGHVDFGASDAAMTDTQIGEVDHGDVQMLPMTAGMIVLAYNLDGLGGELKLPRDVYAGIFQGTITDWDDKQIKAANPTLKLPAQKITPVHRLGASGTTFVLTQHLSAINKSWGEKIGHGLTVSWPAGDGAIGPDGVISKLQQTPGAIGYLDFGTATRNKLPVASLENKSGEFVAPNMESAQQALASAKLPENLRVWVPDPDAKFAYPIVTYTWILVHRHYSDDKVASALKGLLEYSLTDGQTACSALGYVPLPSSVRELALSAVKKL